jgi:hypothetical protein
MFEAVAVMPPCGTSSQANWRRVDSIASNAPRHTDRMNK